MMVVDDQDDFRQTLADLIASARDFGLVGEDLRPSRLRELWEGSRN